MTQVRGRLAGSMIRGQDAIALDRDGPTGDATTLDVGRARPCWRIIMGTGFVRNATMRTLVAITALLVCPVLLPSASADDGVPSGLSARLKVLAPDMEPDQVAAAPLAGMYEVRFGSIIVYLSSDGRYMLRGDLVDLEDGRNVTEEARESVRSEIVGALAEESMIVFTPQTVKHTVTIFTDVDCPYCAKLHREMADYNQLGIKVQYTAFPRAGIGSPTYDKMVSVWCAKDQRAAMTDAKAGIPIETARCDNPVSEHYQIGKTIGVRGTPAIVLESGEIVPGYVPAEDLARQLAERGSS